VTKIARPLPVDYLIIDLPAAFAKETMFTFNENSKHLKTRFPIENRKQIGELQNFEVLAKYMRQFPANSFLEAVSNFHLLLFLIIDNTVHFDNVIDPLLEAIKTKNARNAEKWAKTCAEWQTIEQFFPVDSRNKRIFFPKIFSNF
jgi:nuclear protein localization family protein 4